jgi:uncharacterized membrane protein YgcG
MERFVSLRQRPAIALLTLSLCVLALPGIARADLLVNDFNDATASSAAIACDPNQVAPAVAFCPRGPADEEPTPVLGSGGLLALFGICVHPPIDPPSTTSKSTTAISGSSGGGSSKTGGGGGHTTGGGGGTVTIASTSPEPASLLSGLLGAGLAAVAALARRKRLALLA